MATASLQNMGKSTLRTVKNYTKGYSDVQTKVREATSNDAWGPSGTQMNEVAQMTYNQQDFVEVMEMLDKRLNDKGKNWRHVFKSLTVLDYILHAGSENVVLYFRENLYIVKTLKEFVYVDEDGKDQGQNVRQKAKDITSLLMDEARLKEARRTRANMRERLAGGQTDVTVPDEFLAPRAGRSSRSTPQPDRQRRQGSTREDEDLRRAIEESKRTAENDGRPKQSNNGDEDLEKALRLSREEDEKRKRMMESSSALFDEQQEARDSLIDFNGQPQQTMPQQTGMMPQFTGMPQFNSYNPYAAQQQQAQQEEYMRMQQQLEMQRQMEEQAQLQQMMQQQAYLQQQQQLQAQQQMQQMQYMQQQQQPLVPQPTAFGSNNPFAAFSSPSPAPQPIQSQVTGFAPQQTSPPMPSTAFAPSSPAPKRQNQADTQHANLAAALATGSGVDTFGNAGDLRLGHTNPFNRAQKTGVQSQQTGFGGQQQQQQQAAQPFFQL